MDHKEKLKEADDCADELHEAPLAPMAADGAEHSEEESRATRHEQKNDGDARLAEIRRMFEGKAMSYFVMAERAREYHDIYAKRDIAQNAQNPRVGRPGVVSAMARELAVPGNTPAARRAWLDRALMVARMSPQAVEAAKKAKLNRNQSALIEIAEADCPSEQLQRVEQIKQRKEKKRKEAKSTIKKIVCFPAERSDEIFEKLIAFAEEHGITVEG